MRSNSSLPFNVKTVAIFCLYTNCMSVNYNGINTVDFFRQIWSIIINQFKYHWHDRKCLLKFVFRNIYSGDLNDVIICKLNIFILKSNTSNGCILLFSITPFFNGERYVKTNPISLTLCCVFLIIILIL